MMTLNQIRRTTTPEYLGPKATEDDVQTYLKLLANNWPAADADEAVDDEAADVVQTVSFNQWCKGVTS